MKTENILIVLLIITAVFLGSLFIGQSAANEAYAGDSGDRAGDYIVITCAVTDSVDYYYVIDVTKEHIIAYFIDPIQKKIKIVDDKISLKRVFG